jgi:nondiscriminating aspartyl-tRNA synthetase
VVATKTQCARTLACEASDHLNQRIQLKGWVHNVRTLSNVTFVILRDRSGMVQTVLDPNIELNSSLKEESVVELEGVVVPEPRASQGCEVHVDNVRILQAPVEALPIQLNRPMKALKTRIDTALNHRSLSLRHPEIHAVFQIQGEMIWAFREFLRSQGFTEIRTPKIIATGTEGGTELFPIQYFEQQAYLAQSPQFYKQMLVGAGYERVFETGPVYRAESHNTSRHLNEYVSLDLEMGFIENEQDLLAIETELLRFVLNHVRSSCSDALEQLEVEVNPAPETIPQMTLAEAAKVLKTKYEKNIEGDLDTEAERLLCEYVLETFNSEFVFVTHYPTEVRPMYAMPDPENSELTSSFDLLYRGLEITTGGQRIHNYEQLVNSIRNRGLGPEDFEFYLDAFKYGMPPHGGFAIGAERLTMLMLGLSNVREACMFPRDRTRVSP